MADTLAQLVRCLFKYERRKQHELAAFLRLVPSSLSNGLKRPGALERHREGIAKWIGVSPERLREVERLEGEELEDAVAAMLDATRPRDIQIPAGWLVPLARRAMNAYGPGRWAYVIKRSPRQGELVAYADRDGYYLGHWAQDGDTQVVVGPRNAVKVLGKDASCLPVILVGERPEVAE